MNTAGGAEYQLQLQAFAGPLDLLLHLIEREELDIYQIPIAHVTDQYMAMLHHSLSAQMEVASEFIVMAATLIALKARSLLPRPSPQEVQLSCDLDAEYADPEYELAQRLLEYRAFKEVSQSLQTMEYARSQVVGRIPLALEPFRVNPDGVNVLAGLSLDQLLAAFQKALQRTQATQDVSIMKDRETIPERMRVLERQLRVSPMSFFDLLKSRNRREIVTVFLALLELIRVNRVLCSQEGKFGDIWIELIK